MKYICALLVLIVAAGASISAQAADSSQSARRHINLPKPVQGGFSDGVLVGNTLYIAGRLGIDPKTGKPPEDVDQEARIVLDGVLCGSIFRAARDLFEVSSSWYQRVDRLWNYLSTISPRMSFTARGSFAVWLPLDLCRAVSLHLQECRCRTVRA